MSISLSSKPSLCCILNFKGYAWTYLQQQRAHRFSRLIPCTHCWIRFFPRSVQQCTIGTKKLSWRPTFHERSYTSQTAARKAWNCCMYMSINVSIAIHFVCWKGCSWNLWRYQRTLCSRGWLRVFVSKVINCSSFLLKYLTSIIQWSCDNRVAFRSTRSCHCYNERFRSGTSV